MLLLPRPQVSHFSTVVLCSEYKCSTVSLRLMILLFFIADTCPAPPKNLLCFIGLKNTCTDSIKCRKGTLCCDDGCRRRCRDPSNDSRGAGQGTKIAPKRIFFLSIVGSKFFMSTVGRKLIVPFLGFFLFNFYS